MTAPPKFQVVVERLGSGEESDLLGLLPTHSMAPAPNFMFRFIHHGREVMTFRCSHIEMEAGAEEAFRVMLDRANEGP